LREEAEVWAGITERDQQQIKQQQQLQQQRESGGVITDKSDGIISSSRGTERVADTTTTSKRRGRRRSTEEEDRSGEAGKRRVEGEEEDRVSSRRRRRRRSVEEERTKEFGRRSSEREGEGNKRDRPSDRHKRSGPQESPARRSGVKDWKGEGVITTAATVGAALSQRHSRVSGEFTAFEHRSTEPTRTELLKENESRIASNRHTDNIVAESDVIPTRSSDVKRSRQAALERRHQSYDSSRPPLSTSGTAVEGRPVPEGKPLKQRRSLPVISLATGAPVLRDSVRGSGGRDHRRALPSSIAEAGAEPGFAEEKETLSEGQRKSPRSRRHNSQREGEEIHSPGRHASSHGVRSRSGDDVGKASRRSSDVVRREEDESRSRQLSSADEGRAHVHSSARKQRQHSDSREYRRVLARERGDERFDAKEYGGGITYAVTGVGNRRDRDLAQDDEANNRRALADDGNEGELEEGGVTYAVTGRSKPRRGSSEPRPTRLERSSEPWNLEEDRRSRRVAREYSDHSERDRRRVVRDFIELKELGDHSQQLNLQPDDDYRLRQEGLETGGFSVRKDDSEGRKDLDEYRLRQESGDQRRRALDGVDDPEDSRRGSRAQHIRDSARQELGEETPSARLTSARIHEPSLADRHIEVRIRSADSERLEERGAVGGAERFTERGVVGGVDVGECIRLDVLDRGASACEDSAGLENSHSRYSTVAGEGRSGSGTSKESGTLRPSDPRLLGATALVPDIEELPENLPLTPAEIREFKVRPFPSSSKQTSSPRPSRRSSGLGTGIVLGPTAAGLGISLGPGVEVAGSRRGSREREMGSDGRKPSGGGAPPRQLPPRPRTIVTVTSPTSPDNANSFAHNEYHHHNGDVGRGGRRTEAGNDNEDFDDLFTQAKSRQSRQETGLQVEQINHEWDRRSSRGSLRSRSSHGGSFRSRSGSVRRIGGAKRFLGVNKETAWTRWSRDRRASYRRRIEMLENQDTTTELARVSTPVRKGRQEGLKFVHPDLEGKLLSEDDLNELRRHKQQKYHAIRVIEKTGRKSKFRLKTEVHLTAEQLQVISEYWEHPAFVRGRIMGLFLMVVVFIIMVVSITDGHWLSYGE
jgi:hypothetical protein